MRTMTTRLRALGSRRAIVSSSYSLLATESPRTQRKHQVVNSLTNCAIDKRLRVAASVYYCCLLGDLFDSVLNNPAQLLLERSADRPAMPRRPRKKLLKAVCTPRTTSKNPHSAGRNVALRP